MFGWFKKQKVDPVAVRRWRDAVTKMAREPEPYLRGWTPDTIKEGDQVKVHGHLGRDGRKLLSLISIELADGTKLSVNY